MRRGTRMLRRSRVAGLRILLAVAVLLGLVGALPGAASAAVTATTVVGRTSGAPQGGPTGAGGVHRIPARGAQQWRADDDGPLQPPVVADGRAFTLTNAVSKLGAGLST